MLCPAPGATPDAAAVGAEFYVCGDASIGREVNGSTKLAKLPFVR
jgi:hypothetical protein